MNWGGNQETGATCRKGGVSVALLIEISFAVLYRLFQISDYIIIGSLSKIIFKWLYFLLIKLQTKLFLLQTTKNKIFSALKNNFLESWVPSSQSSIKF